MQTCYGRLKAIFNDTIIKIHDTYFICFTIVLLPDSPAPEKNKVVTFNQSIN